MNWNLVRITNRIAVFGVLALVYWTTIFIVITTFGLKIFRESITESFYLSILAILSVIGGAAILNLMSNMTIVSEKISGLSQNAVSQKVGMRKPVLILGPLLIIIIGLFFGNWISNQKKKNHLIASAKYMIDQNQMLEAIADTFEFSQESLFALRKQIKISERGVTSRALAA